MLFVLDLKMPHNFQIKNFSKRKLSRQIRPNKKEEETKYKSHGKKDPPKDFKHSFNTEFV